MVGLACCLGGSHAPGGRVLGLALGGRYYPASDDAGAQHELGRAAADNDGPMAQNMVWDGLARSQCKVPNVRRR